MFCYGFRQYFVLNIEASISNTVLFNPDRIYLDKKIYFAYTLLEKDISLKMKITH